MNSAIGLKNPDWDLSRSRYNEIDDLPLMNSPGAVVTILAVYLLFVLKVGPAYMSKRAAYNLTLVMFIYNAVQVVASAYMVWKFFFYLVEMGLFPKKCYMNDSSTRNKILLGTFIYLSAKISELLDTVFFVLRKKDSQVTFLHLYHHTIMVIGTWATLKYWPSHTLVFIGFLNSLVHVIMYSYYGLSALGPTVAKYLTWKKYITKLQLTQFVSIIIQYVVAVKISECPPSRGVAIFISSNTGIIMLLFLNFYRENYIKRKSARLVNNDFSCVTNGVKLDSSSSNFCTKGSTNIQKQNLKND